MNLKTAGLLVSTLLPCAANAQGYLPYQAYQGTVRGAPAPQLPQAPYQTQPAFNPYPTQPQVLPYFQPQTTTTNCIWVGTFLTCNSR
jgi:hypothetical protein